MKSDRWEFPRHRLKFFNILGEGAFGQVWRCEAVDIDGTYIPHHIILYTCSMYMHIHTVGIIYIYLCHFRTDGYFMFRFAVLCTFIIPREPTNTQHIKKERRKLRRKNYVHMKYWSVGYDCTYETFYINCVYAHKFNNLNYLLEMEEFWYTFVHFIAFKINEVKICWRASFIRRVGLECRLGV